MKIREAKIKVFNRDLVYRKGEWQGGMRVWILDCRAE